MNWPTEGQWCVALWRYTVELTTFQMENPGNKGMVGRAHKILIVLLTIDLAHTTLYSVSILVQLVVVARMCQT